MQITSIYSSSQGPTRCIPKSPGQRVIYFLFSNSAYHILDTAIWYTVFVTFFSAMIFTSIWNLVWCFKSYKSLTKFRSTSHLLHVSQLGSSWTLHDMVQQHFPMSSSIGWLKSLTLSQMTNFRLFRTERVCRRQFQI